LILTDFQNFPGLVALFHDFPVLENAKIKFTTFQIFQDLYGPCLVFNIRKLIKRDGAYLVPWYCFVPLIGDWKGENMIKGEEFCNSFYQKQFLPTTMKGPPQDVFHHFHAICLEPGLEYFCSIIYKYLFFLTKCLT